MTDTIPFTYKVNNNHTVNFSGHFPRFAEFKQVMVIASNPIDSMTTYSGSGLPFQCEDIAFENTPNILYLTSPSFEGTFKYPNSYYEYDNWVKIQPSIFVVATTHDSKMLKWQQKIEDPLLLRSLNYRPTFYKGPEFYSQKEYKVPLTSAEDTMKNIKIYKEKYNASI